MQKKDTAVPVPVPVPVEEAVPGTASLKEKKEEKAVPLAKIPPPLSQARKPTVEYDAVIQASMSHPPVCSLLAAYLLNVIEENEIIIMFHPDV